MLFYTIIHPYKAQESLKVEGCCNNIKGGSEKCILWGYTGQIIVYPRLGEINIVMIRGASSQIN